MDSSSSASKPHPYSRRRRRSRSHRIAQLDYPPSSSSATTPSSPSASASAHISDTRDTSTSSFSALRFDVRVNPNLAMPTTARGQPIELVFHNDWHIDPTVTVFVHFHGDGIVSTRLSPQASGLVPLPPNYVCEAGTVKLYPPSDEPSSDSSDGELGEEDSISGSDIEGITGTDRNNRDGHPQAHPRLLRLFHSLARVLIWLTIAILCDSLLHNHHRQHHQRPLYQHAPHPTAPGPPRPTMFEALPIVTDIVRSASAHAAIPIAFFTASDGEAVGVDDLILRINRADGAVSELCQWLIMGSDIMDFNSPWHSSDENAHADADVQDREDGEGIQRTCEAMTALITDASTDAISVVNSVAHAWSLPAATMLMHMHDGLRAYAASVSSSSSSRTTATGDHQNAAAGDKLGLGLEAIASANRSAIPVVTILSRHILHVTQQTSEYAREMGELEQTLAATLRTMDAILARWEACFLSHAPAAEGQMGQDDTDTGASRWAKVLDFLPGGGRWLRRQRRLIDPAEAAANARHAVDGLRGAHAVLATQVAAQADLAIQWRQMHTALSDLRMGRGWLLQDQRRGSEHDEDGDGHGDAQRYDVHLYVPAVPVILNEIGTAAEAIYAQVGAISERAMQPSRPSRDDTIGKAAGLDAIDSDDYDDADWSEEDEDDEDEDEDEYQEDKEVIDAKNSEDDDHEPISRLRSKFGFSTMLLALYGSFLDRQTTARTTMATSAGSVTAGVRTHTATLLDRGASTR